MFEFFRTVVAVSIPIFVLSTMLNVGLTQRPTNIVGYLKEWPFILKMVVANFVLVPLMMILILRVTSFEPALQAGLLVFSLCAGAPFLIKLTQTAEHDLALGAATMMLLMVLTVAYVPLVLPKLLTGISVNAWAIARTLLLQMMLPIAIGMIAAHLLPRVTRPIQPWVAKIANLSLYVVIVATLIGYLPNMVDILGSGAVLAGMVMIAAAFGIGYLAGSGEDHLEDVGGLGTAQRNTAAGLIIATENFTNPDVLVVLTLVNMLGIVMLLFVAKILSRDNEADLEMV